jgi:hypothetical protein
LDNAEVSIRREERARAENSRAAVITVTGKAFYDIGHAPANHSNRRSTPKGYAVWEIHPVAAEKQRRLLEMTPAKNAPVSA